MRFNNIICLLIFVFFARFIVDGQTTRVVFDQTKTVTAEKVAPQLEQLIRREALSKAKKLISADTCDEKFNIIGAANGAFTRVKAEQTAVVYEYCQTGNGFAEDGIVIVENQKLTAHYLYQGGWNLSVKSLPDINQNGLDELLIEASGGMHQGFYGSGIEILEFSADAVNSLGGAVTNTNECEEERGEECPHAFAISVKPGAEPIFFRQRFDEQGENKWKKVGIMSKFSLNKSDNKYDPVK